MPDTWITDFRDMLDRDDRISPHNPARHLAKYFASIVEAVSATPHGSTREHNIKCRRKPNRKPCSGKIHAGFQLGTSNIVWQCPQCGDRGVLSNWQNTEWDGECRGSLPKIDRMTYRRAFLSDTEVDEALDAIVFEGGAIPREVLLSIHDNELLGKSGDYGDPHAGHPVQCDHLRIEHCGETTEIIVYNRAIMLFHSNDEIFKRVHRLCCAIETATKVS